MRISEGQVLLWIVGLGRVAEFGGTAGSLHGQDQDQEGLVEMTVMELGCLAEDIGDDIVSEVEFLEDGRFQFHDHQQGVEG